MFSTLYHAAIRGFFKSPLAFPAWEAASLIIRLWWHWRGQCGKLDCSLYLPPPAFSTEFFHFRWNNTFCLTSYEVLHFVGLALRAGFLRSTSAVLNSPPSTIYRVKIFFSQYTIMLWDVQKLVKHSTLCLNCFSELLTPFLKGLWPTRMSWPRKAH